MNRFAQRFSPVSASCVANPQEIIILATKLFPPAFGSESDSPKSYRVSPSNQIPTHLLKTQSHTITCLVYFAVQNRAQNQEPQQDPERRHDRPTRSVRPTRPRAHRRPEKSRTRYPRGDIHGEQQQHQIRILSIISHCPIYFHRPHVG